MLRALIAIAVVAGYAAIAPTIRSNDYLGYSMYRTVIWALNGSIGRVLLLISVPAYVILISLWLGKHSKGVSAFALRVIMPACVLGALAWWRGYMTRVVNLLNEYASDPIIRAALADLKLPILAAVVILVSGIVLLRYTVRRHQPTAPAPATTSTAGRERALSLVRFAALPFIILFCLVNLLAIFARLHTMVLLSGKPHIVMITMCTLRKDHLGCCRSQSIFRRTIQSQQ